MLIHVGRILRLGERIEALTPAVLTEAASVPLPPTKGSVEPDIGSLVRNVLHCLDDAKAEEVATIDLLGKTSIADVMVVATGRSSTHVGAIADRIIRALKEDGRVPRVEGQPHNDWVLIDAGDVVVHIFRPEVRQFYNLEKMWGGDRPDEQNSPRRPG
jgi:ribosome-associated protein